jgi:hypothetical protein
MFDLGDFAHGNVRIAHDLRRRWYINRNHHAGHYGDAGSIDVFGDIDVDRNCDDVWSVDNVWHAGNVRIIGNVRLGLEQHRCIVEPNVKRAYSGERQHTCRNSDGIL